MELNTLSKTWLLFPLLLLVLMHAEATPVPAPVPVMLPGLTKRSISISQTLPDELDDEIQCIPHHEFASFVHSDEISHFEPRSGTEINRIPSLRTYVNRNGKVKYYFCSPCSQCGEGVRILAQCHIRQDIVCSTVCLDPEWAYDDYTERCYSVQSVHGDTTTEIASTQTTTTELVTYQITSWVNSTSHWLTGRIRYITSDGDTGLNDAEEERNTEHTKGNSWTHEFIPITVGVLTLNIMFAVLLIWKRRDCKRKKIAQKLTQRDQERRNQNNSPQTPRIVETEANRPETSHAVINAVESSTPSATSFNNRVVDNVLVNPEMSTNRVKENNLNQYVVNYTPGIESHTDASNIVQPQIVTGPEIKIQPGTNPYWIEMSAYFGPQGGELSCDQSDVVVEIPPGAIPTSQTHQLIIVRVSRTPGIFPVELTKEALFLAPLVDCESPGLSKFEKDVVIKLPHRAHLGSDWQFMVHHTTGTSTGETDPDWSTIKAPCHEARRDWQNTAHIISRAASDPSKSEVQFTIDEKYVNVSTPHFSKYTCSGCSRKRELSFEAVVYVNDNQITVDRRVDLHCYLLDSVKDFQSKVNYNEAYRPRSEHKPLIIKHVKGKRGKELEISLMDMGENWPWKADERIHKTTQIVHLDNIVRCHSDVVPHFVTFTLRPRYPHTDDKVLKGNQTLPESIELHTYLEAAVSIKQRSQEEGITVDIALNLDPHSTDEKCDMQDAGKDIKKTDFDVILMTLSTKITARQWRPLFRSLMTTSSGCPFNVEADISFIENKDPGDLKEQIYQGFLKWLTVAGKNATVVRLCQTLRKEELVKLAEEIEDTYQEPPEKKTTQIEEIEPLLNTEDLDQQNTWEGLETDV